MSQLPETGLLNDSPACTARRFRDYETRLDELCNLIDEELKNGGLQEEALQEYVRKMTGTIDQAFAEEVSWFADSDFI